MKRFDPSKHPRGDDPANPGRSSTDPRGEVVDVALVAPTASAAVSVPAHDTITVRWSQAMRGGTQQDRTMRSVDASLPPRIADLDPIVPAALGPSAKPLSLSRISRRACCRTP